METHWRRRDYTNVRKLTIEDYYHDGRRFAVLELGYGEKIITNGETETVIRDDDLDLMEISDEMEDGSSRKASEDKVNNILALRLGQISEAILSQRAELEMKEKLLHDTLRSLHIECGLDTELVIGGSGEVRGGREERLRVSGHWTRMVTGEWLVLGLALTSGLEPVTNISLQVVSDQDCHLDYQWRLLTWRCPGILHSSTSMAASQSSVAAASLSLSSCISPQPLTLRH